MYRVLILSTRLPPPPPTQRKSPIRALDFNPKQSFVTSTRLMSLLRPAEKGHIGSYHWGIQNAQVSDTNVVFYRS